MMTLTTWLELYKCIVLTVIAIMLVALYIHKPIPPIPYTLENVRNKKVKVDDIPLVRIKGGNVTVDGSVTVDGNVFCDN